MDEKEALSIHGDIHQAYKDLDQISKLLIERDAKLTEANAALEEKNKTIEQAREELLRTSEFLSNLLDYSPDAIWVIDNNKKVIKFNKMAEEISGYSPDKIIGKSLNVLFKDDSHYCHLLENLDVHGNHRNIRTIIRRKNGEKAELLMSISLLREEGGHGNPIGSVTISKDITREVKLENALSEANERLEAKVQKRTQDLEVLSQSLIVMNQVSTIAGQTLETKLLLETILNLVLELTGFSMGAMSTIDDSINISLEAEKNLSEVIKKRIKNLKQNEGIIGKAAASGFLQIAAPQLTELRKSRIRLVVAVPLRAKGNICGVMSLFTESPRVIQDEERDMLLAIGIQVAGAIENGKLYEQVRKDIKKLREVDRIKTEFIATISHELRTPLTSIIGFLSYALMDFDQANIEKIKRYISIALDNAQKLAYMIEDLLAMQKIDSGTLKLRLEPVNLKDLLNDISQDLKPQLRTREQKLKLDIPDDFPDILVDKEQIERVITNLITNAIKFSEKAGKILVTCRHNKKKKEFKIRVKDCGIGMAPETCEKIFDRFYQAENTLTRKAGGAGLGLTIAQRIVEIHNGRIEVESQLSKGSCFKIFIPEIIEEKEVNKNE